MKLILFSTNDLSFSSVLSKYSTSFSFLLKSLTSSFNCSVFPIGGVGVNMRPLFNKDISAEPNVLLDELIIFVSFGIASSIACWAGDRGLGLCLGHDPCPVPGPCLCPDLGLKNKVLHFHNFHPALVTQCLLGRTVIVLIDAPPPSPPPLRYFFPYPAEKAVALLPWTSL